MSNFYNKNHHTFKTLFHKSCNFLKGFTGVWRVSTLLVLLFPPLLELEETGTAVAAEVTTVLIDPPLIFSPTPPPAASGVTTPQSEHKGSNPNPAIPLLGVEIVIGGAGVVTLISPLLDEVVVIPTTETALLLTFKVLGLFGFPPMN